MKHLVVYAHPNPKSLNHALKQSLVDHLRQQAHQVEVRDLYQIGFDPVLSMEDMAGQRMGVVADDVKQEQEFIAWADCITLIYPMWWTGLPAIIKGYIDRVFSYGFSYCYEGGIQKGLLTNKRVVIVNTHGKSKAEYQEIGMDQALSLTSDTGIYQYCGMEIRKHFYFDKADRLGSDNIDNWTSELLESYKEVSLARSI